MSAQWLLGYLGGAVLRALLLTTLTLGIVAVASGRPSIARRGAPLALATLFVVVLAFHPLPAAHALDCADGGVQPVLTLSDAVRGLEPLMGRDASVGEWLGSLTVAQSVANVAFFALPGIALAWWTHHLAVAALFGAVLSLGIEIAQLTALFGIYPCPWRRFDVFDIGFNIAGVTLGFILGRWWVQGSKSA